MASNIKYLQRKEINTAQWDACIDRASNGLIYSYTYYLDAMASHWDGLVLNNYEAVMPLTWRKKWNIYYLYQPFLTAQTGVFGKQVTLEMMEAFLTAIPKKFLYWDLSFNHQNIFSLETFPLHLRTNYTLNLNDSYDLLYDRYRQNIKRNIKKAVHRGCIVKNEIAVADVIHLAKEFTPGIAKYGKELDQFQQLSSFLKEKQQATTYAVYSSRNELLASCIFFFSHNRAYYILVGNHPNGRKSGASHLLIDAFIKDHAGENLLLDFEGSDLQNLAFFYNGFGAVEEKYSAIKRNRLPWYVKWLKK